MSPWDEACPGSWHIACIHVPTRTLTLTHTRTHTQNKVPWGGQQSPREDQPPSSELKPGGVRQGSQKSPLPAGARCLVVPPRFKREIKTNLPENMPSSLKLIRRGGRKQPATPCLSTTRPKKAKQRKCREMPRAGLPTQIQVSGGELLGPVRSPHPNTSTRVASYNASLI